MLFEFFKKQTQKNNKIVLLTSLIKGLKIPDSQKQVYVGSLDVLSENELDELYLKITDFVKNVEIDKVTEIQKSNFSSIKGLKKREAEERKEELNSLNLLLDNI